MALTAVNATVKIRKVVVTYNAVQDKTTVQWDAVRITSAGEERALITNTDGGKVETEAYHNTKVAALHTAYGIT